MSLEFCTQFLVALRLRLFPIVLVLVAFAGLLLWMQNIWQLPGHLLIMTRSPEKKYHVTCVVFVDWGYCHYYSPKVVAKIKSIGKKKRIASDHDAAFM